MTDRELLKEIVKAWDALPVGAYIPTTVAHWLAKDMQPTISLIRLRLQVSSDFSKHIEENLKIKPLRAGAEP